MTCTGPLGEVEPVDVLVGTLLLDHEHRRPQREHVVQRGHVELDALDLGPGQLAGCHGGILACPWCTGRVRFGAHLPLMDLGSPRWSVEALVEYAETATALGFEAICANDHLVFGTPWLDGPTALAAVAAATGDARLVTTVANPVVRGPAALAKTLAGLDVLSGGRVVAGLGPGSSARDYEVVGVSFDERWPRFGDALAAMAALLRGDAYEGRFYSCPSTLAPLPVQPGGIPLWVASWGSDHGLNRAARAGRRLAGLGVQHHSGGLRSCLGLDAGAARAAARPLEGFANALATMWFHLDDQHGPGVLEERLAPVMHRPVEELRQRLPFGPAEAMVESWPPSATPACSGPSSGPSATSSSSCTASATR